MDWILEIAKIEFGFQHIENFPDLAVRALEEGDDTLSLRILAGLNERDIHEIHDYLEKVLKERNLKNPSREESARFVIEYFIDQIIDKKVIPSEGLNTIIDRVYKALDCRDKDNKYVADYIGLEKLYGLYDTHDELINANERWAIFKSNKKLLEELEVEIYQAAIEYKTKIFNNRAHRKA